MVRTRRCLSVSFSVLTSALLAMPAVAAPRDAAAVLNRCGKPLKGDTTILESTPAGGRRLLAYERGTLSFDKVGNIGWTFSSGSHGKLTGLNAEQMAKYMPCLTDALADSAAPAPLVSYTPIRRAEASLKRDFTRGITWAFCGLVTLGIVLFLLSRRSAPGETVEE